MGTAAWLFLVVLAFLAGYLIGYSVCLWEHNIKFDRKGQRIS